MKLAEALAERAEIQTRLAQLQARATENARIQEGDEVAEDPAALAEEAERLFARLQELMSRINLTNSRTAFDETRSITDAIAERDLETRRAAFYAGLADAAAARMDRFSRSEVKFVATVDVKATRAKADAAAKRRRELDTRLQQLNWTTELV